MRRIKDKVRGAKRRKRKDRTPMSLGRNLEIICAQTELRKCGTEEKHDKSSRYSAMTVIHTRAQVHWQGQHLESEVERSIERLFQKDRLNMNKKRHLCVCLSVSVWVCSLHLSTDLEEH